MAKKKNIPEVPTLAFLSEAFLAALQMDGRTSGTAASYANDLKVAATFLGAGTDIRTLTVERVREFYDSDAVMKKRDGSPKNAISIAKTRRILRLALIWAVASRWIEVAPLPDDEAPATTAKTAMPSDAAHETTVNVVATPHAEIAPEAAALPQTAETDPVADLPRFDHEALAPDAPVKSATAKSPKSAKKLANRK